MSEQETLYVSKNDVIVAGFNQYKEASGTSHALKIVNGNQLEYEEGTSYYTDESISAYDVCKVLEFKREHPDDIRGEELPRDALHQIELKDEVEIGGTTYEVCLQI